MIFPTAQQIHSRYVCTKCSTFNIDILVVFLYLPFTKFLKLCLWSGTGQNNNNNNDVGGRLCLCLFFWKIHSGWVTLTTLSLFWVEGLASEQQFLRNFTLVQGGYVLCFPFHSLRFFPLIKNNQNHESLLILSTTKMHSILL